MHANSVRDQYLCIASPNNTHTRYEEADRETNRDLLKFAHNHTSLLEWQTKTTTYQEARNNAGLPLQQNRITCVPSGQRTPPHTSVVAGTAGQRMRCAELPAHLTPMRAGAGASCNNMAILKVQQLLLASYFTSYITYCLDAFFLIHIFVV